MPKAPEASTKPQPFLTAAFVSMRHFLWLFLLTLSFNTHAQLTYTAKDGAITITGYDLNIGDLIIPRTIEGLPVTAIGAWAFKDRVDLTSVTIPDSVSSIGEFAFFQCTGLKAFIADKANPTFSSVDGILFNKLQTTLIQYPIGRVDFSDAIPKSVTTLGDRAFQFCTGLTNVTIPNSVTTIGLAAFLSCTSLTSLTIPDSVTTLGNGAFLSCTSLASVTIPGSVAAIGDYPFGHCTSLEAISVVDTNPFFSGVDGVLFNKLQTTLLQYPIAKAGFSYTIPSSVTTVGNLAFADCSGLASLTIPNSVTTIGPVAFVSCTSLTGVTIPNSVTTIGDGSFAYCTSLASVNIPGSVSVIGDFAFGSCNRLKDISVDETNPSFGSMDGILFNKLKTTLIQYPISKAGFSYDIPNGVTIIGNSAFSGCTGLTNVAIPNSLTTIGESAFYGCSGLATLTIPNTVTTIGDSAFHGCTSFSSVSIPNGVTAIGRYAFYDCRGLKSVIIPNSVTTIGDHAFDFCESLTGVTIPNNVTNIGSFLFYLCTSLTSVTIPNSVTTIGDSAFADCNLLTSLTIPNSVTTIGDSVFADCHRLTGLAIPNSVTTIGDSAFSRCGSLTSLTIPNAVTTIGDHAFYQCFFLTNVTLGSGVTNLGNYAFYQCQNLKAVYFEGNRPTLLAHVFDLSTPTIYYLPGTTGWGAATYAGRPTVLWNPSASTANPTFGVKDGQFGFTITGSNDIQVVVEACDNLAQPVWLPVSTNTLTSGSSPFTDPTSTNHPSRIYRFRSP